MINKMNYYVNIGLNKKGGDYIIIHTIQDILSKSNLLNEFAYIFSHINKYTKNKKGGLGIDNDKKILEIILIPYLLIILS